MRIFRAIRPLVFILIPVMLWIGYNNASNWHYHKLNHGIIAKHSHGYEKSAGNGIPANNHHHEKWELIILDQVFDSLLIFFSLFALASALKRSFRIIRLKPIRVEVNVSHNKLIPVRGPPSVLF